MRRLKSSLIFPFFLYLLVVTCLCVRPVHGLTLLSSSTSSPSNLGLATTSANPQMNGAGIIVQGNDQYLAEYHIKCNIASGSIKFRVYIWDAPNATGVTNGVAPVAKSSEIAVSTSGFTAIPFDCTFQLAKNKYYAIIPMCTQNVSSNSVCMDYYPSGKAGVKHSGYYFGSLQSSYALLWGKVTVSSFWATHYCYTTDVFGGWGATPTGGYSGSGSGGGAYVGGGIVVGIGIVDYLVMFFVVFMPACILGSAVKQNRLAGLLAGLCLGVGMGVIAGILPFYLVFLIALLIAFLLLKGRL